MQITALGIIQALKNIGLFLSTYVIADVQANPEKFIFAFVVYACISIPSDLFLINKAHESAENGKEEET